jgi:hypothetical protein
MVFPVLECIHIFGFILLAGSIALVDFRVLVGLGLVLTSGALLFASDPDHYYLNRAFQIKMAILVAALGFHHTIHRRALQASSPAASGKLAAYLSLALWMGVIGGGIFIGFVTGPE